LLLLLLRLFDPQNGTCFAMSSSSSSSSQEFREPNPGFQALLTKWRAQDSDNLTANARRSAASTTHSTQQEGGDGPARASSGRGGGAPSPGRLPSASASASSTGSASDDSPAAAEDKVKKPTYKKRAIGSRRSDRDPAPAAGAASPSSDSDNDGARRSARSSSSKAKAKKKGRKIVKNKNVYQQPLKSLREFRPKVIAKSPDESAQILAALRRNFVFSGMDGRAVAPLVDAFELCGFRAGDTIIRQGEPGACVK
jgi:hypothetical protein